MKYYSDPVPKTILSAMLGESRTEKKKSLSLMYRTLKKKKTSLFTVKDNVFL